MNRATTLLLMLMFVLGGDMIAASANQTAPPTKISDAANIVIPELDVPEGTTVEQLLTLLKTKVPEFQYVERNGGNWQRQTLPKMHLSNFTLDSVLGVIVRLFPSTIHVGDLTDANNAAKQRIYLIGAADQYADVNDRAVSVQVFSLSGPIDRQVNLDGARGIHGQADEARKRAMRAILSLIENTLKQQDDSVPIPSLSIHDETETLIVKGNPGRVAQVHQVLKALDTPVDQAQLRSLQSQNDLLLKENANQRRSLQAAEEAAKAAKSK